MFRKGIFLNSLWLFSWPRNVLLLSSNCHHFFHKTPSLGPILGHSINPLPIFTKYNCKVIFSSIPQSAALSCVFSFFKHSKYNCICTSDHPKWSTLSKISLRVRDTLIRQPAEDKVPCVKRDLRFGDSGSITWQLCNDYAILYMMTMHTKDLLHTKKKCKQCSKLSMLYFQRPWRTQNEYVQSYIIMQ